MSFLKTTYADVINMVDCTIAPVLTLWDA